MRRPALLVAALAAVHLSCADRDPAGPDPTAAALSSASIADGANGGNPRFYFLPPLVKAPSYDGTFNPHLSPVVEVCALAVNGSGCADPQPQGFPLRFTMESGGSEVVRLNEEDEHYALNWQTGQHALDPAVHYRIRVFAVAGGAELGHLDVDVVLRGGGRGSSGGGALTTVQLGTTQPIHFRIEQGISCTDTDDCTEVVVTGAGGVVVVPSEFAGVAIPAGALDAPVLITIERVDVTVGPCLPVLPIQAEGCYRYDTEPALSVVQESGLDEFNVDVVVGICLDPDVLALPEHHQYALHKYDPDQPDLGIVQLPSAPVDYLDCSDFTALALGDVGAFVRLARAGWARIAPLARLLGPARAHAVNLGFGGLTKSFSNIGWARGLAFTLLAGDDQTGLAGSTLPIDPAVLVTATHWEPNEFESAPPVPGAPVTFRFTDPAGGVTEVVDTSDAQGIASVPWVLGAGAGTNTLMVAGATSGEMVVEAIGLPVEIDIDAAVDEGIAAFGLAFVGGTAIGIPGHFDNVATISGMLSDEVAHTGTFPTRWEIDRRAIDPANATAASLFTGLQRARALLAFAAVALEAEIEETEIMDPRLPAVLAMEAYSAGALAENFCSGVPTVTLGEEGALLFGGAQTTAQLLRSAIDLFNEALSVAQQLPQPAGELVNLIQLGRARVYVGLNEFPAAAASAANVPGSFVYPLGTDIAEVPGYTLMNAFYALNSAQRRISVAHGEGGIGLPFRNGDPRITTLLDPLIGFDGMSAVHDLVSHAAGGTLSPDAPFPLASGTEARLIEAEALLRTGNEAAALSVINQLRSSLGMAPILTLNVDILFEERAYWLYATGHRLSDLRRLVRQYGRAAEDIFPTGVYPRGGAYGPDVNLPIPPVAGTCLDRSA